MYMKGRIMNKITLIIAGFLIISCGSFNEANGQGELHLNKNISTGQWIRVFVKYLDDNPQNLNRSATINAAAALKKYYRCKR